MSCPPAVCGVSGHEPGDHPGIRPSWMGRLGGRRSLDIEQPTKLGKVSIGSSLCVTPAECEGSLTFS
jgi:hypothetical protein